MNGTATRPGIFTLDREQTVRRSLEDVFGFFSDARNLEALTPSWLRFTHLDPRSFIRATERPSELGPTMVTLRCFTALQSASVTWPPT